MQQPRAILTTAAFTAMKLPLAAPPPDDQPRTLPNLAEYCGLTDAEFIVCRLLLDLVGTPLADADVAAILKLSDQQFEHVRAGLAAHGLLEFAPCEDAPEKFLYQVFAYWQCILPPPARRRKARRRSSAAQQSWIAFEQGRHAHLLREDDLFPAERTFCGIPAVDADWHPLPRLNSQPADYGICGRCRLLRARRDTI